MEERKVPAKKEKFSENRHQQQFKKQSEKINAVLKTSDCHFSNIQEMKHAIFEAWNTIKKEELKIQKKNKLIENNVDSVCSYNYSKSGLRNSYGEDKQNQSLAIQDSKNEMNSFNKSKLKYTSSTRIKKKKEKRNKNEKQELVSDKQQETYTDEEKEMIFKSWKKKKDELIKQQKALKESLEKQQKLNQLMEQENKKAEAKLAYSSWVTHKALVDQKEKLKNLENQKMEEKATKLKIQKDKEALEMYFLWLESKNSQNQNETQQKLKIPPWFPPGIST